MSVEFLRPNISTFRRSTPGVEGMSASQKLGSNVDSNTSAYAFMLSRISSLSPLQYLPMKSL